MTDIDARDPDDPFGLTIRQRVWSDAAAAWQEIEDQLRRGVYRAPDGTKIIDGEVNSDPLRKQLPAGPAGLA